MNAVEAQKQTKRLAAYNKLEERVAELNKALDDVCCTLPSPTGGRREDPFTADWRESRDVNALRVFFTKTKGGAPAVDTVIDRLNIPAFRLRDFLKEEIMGQIDALSKEMLKI